MSTRRERELLAQNRLLVRQEGLAEREITKVIRAMAEDVASRLTYGDEQASLQIVDEHRAPMRATLAKSLRQTALLFGFRTLDRLSPFMPDGSKSYYGALADGSGPVRGRDEFPLEGVIRTLGIEAKYSREVFEAAIQEWVERHSLERALSIMETLKGAVRRVLVDSFADGTGEAGTARLIRDRIGGGVSLTNAARIARTEMHTAASIGADRAARSTGLALIKEWAAAEDGRTRLSHAIADEQEVALDDPFKVGGALLMVPGDPNGPAREIINCRCAVLHHPVIGGMVIRGDGKPSPPRIGALAPARPKTTEELHEESRAYVLEKGRAENVEHLSAFDEATGQAYPPMRGGFDCCELSPEMVRATADPQARLVMHHNHPRSSSLSGPDVMFVADPGVAAIYAHGHDGSLYEARAGAKRITKPTLKEAGSASYAWLSALMVRRVITPEEAGSIHAHLTNLILHRKERLTYRAELAGKGKAAFAKVEPLIAEILGDTP